MRITPIQIQITPVQPYRPVYRGNSPVQYADLLNRISGYRENGRPKIWALTQSEIFEILSLMEEEDKEKVQQNVNYSDNMRKDAGIRVLFSLLFYFAHTYA